MGGNSMAFTRNWLKTMGLTDEQEKAIMEEHINVTDALKAQRDKAQNDVKELQTKVDAIPGLETQIKDLKSGVDYKAKYDEEHKAFEDYKNQIAAEAELAKVKAAYRKLLVDEKINEKRVDSVLKLTDFSEMKLDKEGNLENLDALKDNIGKEWGEFKVVTKERKQTVATPPGNGNQGGGESRARDLYLNHLKQRGIKVEDAGKE
jgi:hypothetical protein